MHACMPGASSVMRSHLPCQPQSRDYAFNGLLPAIPAAFQQDLRLQFGQRLPNRLQARAYLRRRLCERACSPVQVWQLHLGAAEMVGHLAPVGKATDRTSSDGELQPEVQLVRSLQHLVQRGSRQIPARMICLRPSLNRKPEPCLHLHVRLRLLLRLQPCPPGHQLHSSSCPVMPYKANAAR